MVFLLFLPFVLNADMSFLKLRTSRHPGFLRIVLQGETSVIAKGTVFQSGDDVLVTFPETNFSVRTEKVTIASKMITPDTIMFTPGAFRGVKVFTLKHPARLVIDVYMKEESAVVSPESQQERDRKSDLFSMETIVIDPGHGGYESGIVKDGNSEKNIVLDIARKLRALINSGSSRGYLTRASDRFMTLSERITYANGRDPDIFISLHVGNHSDIVIYAPVITGHVSDIVKQYLDNRGQSDYVEQTLTLLKAMREAFVSYFGEDMVSVKPVPYGITSRIEAASLMIELPSFEDAYYIEELKSEIAGTLYKGLYIYEENKAY